MLLFLVAVLICLLIRRTEALTLHPSFSDEETANIIYTNELEFVQDNLRLNPKSYFMWNHRRWCLENMSKPSWDKELGMVGKFLEMDARNCK